jgi:TonB family protein
VLNHTQGVDLRSYLQTVEKIINIKWYNLIPESARPPIMKRGQVVIEFAILKVGKIAGMKLVSGSGDVALDRGAWGAITASNPVRVPEQVRRNEILVAPPQPSSSAQIGAT